MILSLLHRHNASDDAWELPPEPKRHQGVCTRERGHTLQTVEARHEKQVYSCTFCVGTHAQIEVPQWLKLEHLQYEGAKDCLGDMKRLITGLSISVEPFT